MISQACFYTLWLGPLWLLIYLAVSMPTYQTVRDAVMPGAARTTADEEIYRNLFFILLLVQKYSLPVIPFVGAPLGFFFSLLVASLYAFDYAWDRRDISVPHRHALVEKGWPYFLGFGTPVTILTFFLPVFQSLAVSAAVFPFLLCVANASAEEAIRQVDISVAYVPRIPAFMASCRFAELIVDWTKRFMHSRFGVPLRVR
mmetsp:Transcript_22374/g.65050  ORF Transcript_22374/g.65050 Transcript_22374/m.65050 type:complete len:201 (-) Transcript_22374:43-645(-)